MKRPKFFKLYDFRRISRKFADTLGNRRLCLDLFKLPMATMFSFFERICKCTEVTAAKRVSSKHEVPVTVVADRFGPKRKQNSGKAKNKGQKEMLPTRVELMISTLLVWRLTNLAIEAVLVVEVAPSCGRWVVPRHVCVFTLPVLFFILSSSSSPVKALSYSKEMKRGKR